MVASRKFLLLASLLFAVPALADDLPACNPTNVHDEANDLTGTWRLIVVPQVSPGQTPQCNQLTMSFTNDQIATQAVKIKAYSFASACHEGDQGNAGLKGKVTATYCYIQATSKEVRRVHQILLYNDNKDQPYIASYSLWDNGNIAGQALLKGVGNDAGGGGVNAWLISENK